MRIRTLLPTLCLLAAACGDGTGGGDGTTDRCTITLAPSSNDQETVQTAFIEAASGSTICFEEGIYRFSDELSITVPGITVRGVGDAVVFDFADQEAGANGLHVSGDDFTIENLAIRNTKGDGIRVDGVDGAVFRRLHVSWDAGSVTENGAYAVYPVKSSNVLVEDCTVTGASDAGIYVGQSRKAVVRRNRVFGNVAGIEVENTTDAEVYENEVRDNTGGILVFNLPHLESGLGARTLVRDNRIEANNRANFAPEGNIVALVPAGTGVMLLAADQVELRGNEIRGNDSIGVLVLGYGAVTTIDPSRPPPDDPAYDPYSSGIWIHGNAFEGNAGAPKGLLAAMGPMADVVWDGFDDPALEGTGLCIQNEGATFRSLNLGETKNTRLGDHDCALEPLPSVSL